ncbi:MAG: hypothetical protein GWN61_00685 [candidate division Zixibacteria bacterium]|nr:hypothetical protein [candidate division Zixibacteria bacterium]NIT70437.1 hypothetical protein [candidate division KSB1 bacterium]NIW97395.1 hypothetical protein [Phycisphaerae bacterium]NIU12615.1 hypothetical protein [candidate division Zixibacteria bacterium]NIV04744.1 hypothetical protein [candidate division Zixibacteria bacterium]
MPEAVEAMFDKKLGIEVGHPYDTLIFEEPMAYCDSPMCVSRRAHNQKSPFEMPQRTAEEKRELIKKNEPVHQNCPECGSILKDAEYATGADWARKIDWTIIQTWRIDCNPMRLVCWYRGARQPWALMVEEYDWQIEKYNSNAAHDATGLGDVVAEMVRNPAEDVLMVGRERKDMISEYIGACERGEILMPHIEYVYTEHKFASVDDLFGTGHLPDTISSGAITLIAAGYGGSLAIAI